jgi:hypothetical protein
MKTRFSVRCGLCKTRFMTELSDEETAKKHAEVCEKFRVKLAERIAYMTRAVASSTSAWAKNPVNFAAQELYQMRALYLRFERVHGHVNAEVPCNARCTGARGPNCECQCGGKNHGAGNVMAGGMR